MRIVTQSVPASYSHFPEQSPPQLCLPAPKIVGLLPARTLSAEPAPERPSQPPIIFDCPALVDLTTNQYSRLVEAANVLLEIAVEFMVGTFDEDALRAAEVLFHRAVGGRSAIRSVGPVAFNAEVDADWLELLAHARRDRPLSLTEAESLVRQAQSPTAGGVA